MNDNIRLKQRAMSNLGLFFNSAIDCRLFLTNLRYFNPVLTIFKNSVTYANPVEA